MGVFKFTGNYGDPFRPPCSGWFTPRKWFLGNPWQHYRSADTLLNPFANTTTVKNPMCGDHYGYIGQTACADCVPPQLDDIPPFQIPNPLNIICSAPTDTPCGTFTPPASPDLTGLPNPPLPLTNTFAPKTPDTLVNKAVCKKTGFKIVYAHKAWHGAWPFGDVDQCNACPATDTGNQQATPTLTRYRTITYSATCTYAFGGPAQTETFSGTMTIDRYTGKMSGSYTFEQSGGGMTSDPGHPIRLIFQSDNELTPETLLSARNCGGTWTSGWDSYTNILNGADPTEWTVNTATQSATEIDIALTLYAEGGDVTGSFAGTITLSDPYTSDNVNTDCNGLLGLWDLSNDALYPWRNDAMCSRGPIVSYWEIGASAPSIYLGADYLDPTNPYTWDSSTDIYTYSFTNTITDASPQDGRILGAPNHAPGYDRYWDSTHQIWDFNDAEESQILYWGDYAPDYCPSATQWTDDEDAASLFPGASASFNILVSLINTEVTPPYQHEALVKSKWAEVILLTTPSANYGRPWGYRDSLLRDQTTVDCTGDPTYANQYGNLLFPTCPGIDGQVNITAATNASPIELTFDKPTGLRTGDKIDMSGCTGNTAANGSDQTITVIDEEHATIDGSTGNGAYTGSGIAISHGAPSYEWNDNQPKGDWCLLTWAFDNRTPTSIPVAVSQECSNFLPCCPAVVYITPQDGSQPVGETNGSNNSQSFPHPNLDCDSCYGSLWQCIPKQVMTDPLWQRPVKPCDKSGTMNDGMAWTEDDGSGEADTPFGSPPLEYFPQRPWVECRNTVPTGAPALPSGFTFNAIHATLDPGLQAPIPAGPAGAGAPPNGAWMTPWIWMAKRAANVAAAGRFSCDYANPMAVCSDDSEVSPL